MAACDRLVTQHWSRGGKTASKKLSVSFLRGLVTVNAGPSAGVLGRLSGAAMMMIATTFAEAAGDRKAEEVKTSMNTVVADTDKR